MSKEAADQVRAALEERRRQKLVMIDEMKDWFEQWLLTLSDYQLIRLHKHFEMITDRTVEGE